MEKNAENVFCPQELTRRCDWEKFYESTESRNNLEGFDRDEDTCMEFVKNAV